MPDAEMREEGTCKHFEWEMQSGQISYPATIGKKASAKQARKGRSSLHFSCQRCVGSVEFSGPILLPYMHSVVQSDSEGIRCIFNH